MAWNPAAEVKAARDAAKQLDDAPLCVVIWVTKDGQLGAASYGKTRDLCGQAASLLEHLYKAAEEWK